MIGLIPTVLLSLLQSMKSIDHYDEELTSKIARDVVNRSPRTSRIALIASLCFELHFLQCCFLSNLVHARTGACK